LRGARSDRVGGNESTWSGSNSMNVGRSVDALNREEPAWACRRCRWSGTRYGLSAGLCQSGACRLRA
jgi:hypothetical protein